MTDPIVPTPDDIVGPAIQTLVSLRPKALKHINYGTGVYSHVIAGWRAQAALEIRRIAQAASARRLPLATGADLRDLCASEFDTFADFGPTQAVGDVTIVRSTGPLASGVIPSGSRLRRSANTVPPLLLAAAEYVTVDDTPIAAGQTTSTFRIQAVRSGSFANSLVVRQTLGSSPTSPTGITFSDSLFDTNFAITTYTSAGGSDGVTDDDLRHYASAFVVGQYAPTSGSIIAGALANSGVKRFAYFDDSANVQGKIFVADQSWGSGTRWCNAVQQSIKDLDFVGFNCRMSTGLVCNVVVHVSLTVIVRDQAYLAETSKIDRAIRTAIRRYFDDRPDWYTFKLSGIRAAAARAHPHILTCTSATVADSTGATIPEQSGALSVLFASGVANHFYLDNNAVSISYLAPT